MVIGYTDLYHIKSNKNYVTLIREIFGENENKKENDAQVLPKPW